MGTRGPAILQGAAATENIVALCDLDEALAARGCQQYPKATGCKDRELRSLVQAGGPHYDKTSASRPCDMPRANGGPLGLFSGRG